MDPEFEVSVTVALTVTVLPWVKVVTLGLTTTLVASRTLIDSCAVPELAEWVESPE